MSAIFKSDEPNVRCQCVVDLLGRAPGSIRKPNYRFLVTVWGEPPHAFTMFYEVVAYGEETAAHLGMQRFQRDMSPTQLLLTAIAKELQ